MTKRGRRSSAAAQQAGFSLLELLVALALLAVLAVMLTGALQFGTNVWRHKEVRRDGADLVAAYRTLENNIERALPIPERIAGTNDAFMAFDGTVDEVRFVVANPGHIGRLGDTVLRLAIETRNGTQFLGISWAPYDPKIGLMVETFNETLILLPDVRSISLRYFGASSNDPVVRWSDEWQRQATLPQLVGIDLEDAEERRRSWIFRLRDGG